MIQFTVNAKLQTRESPFTVGAFLEEKGLPPGSVIVEFNRSVLDRKLYGTTVIGEGDTVEIIRAYAGG